MPKEILEKDRKENFKEKNIPEKQESTNFSIWVLLFLWSTITRFTPLDIAGRTAIGLLVNLTCFSHFVYQTVKTKSKISMFFTAAFALSTMFYLYQFFSKAIAVPF